MSKGIKEAHDELEVHVHKLEELGLDPQKIRSLNQSIQILYKLASEKMEFQIGDKAMIVKEINFDNAPGWKAFEKELSVGNTGIVKNCSYNLHHKYEYVDLEIVIPGYKEEGETAIFMFPVDKLIKLKKVE